MTPRPAAGFPLLDLRRLEEFASGREPALFAGIASTWARRLPAHERALRDAAPKELPERLHELRSGAVAIGLPRLADVLAGIEQKAEAGIPPAGPDIDAAMALAERSAEEIMNWWEARLS
ncbi:MAG: hypothetical protein U0Y82_11765 [Thermoleophilia bacterium]